MIDHPGIFLDKELERLGVSPTELARQLMVPPNRFSQIVNGKRAITGDSALRLAHWFRNTPEFWMSLQAQYDLHVAASELGQQIKTLPTSQNAAPLRLANAATNQGKAGHGRR
jgi:antitoxin HigA-1